MAEGNFAPFRNSAGFTLTFPRGARRLCGAATVRINPASTNSAHAATNVRRAALTADDLLALRCKRTAIRWSD